MKLNAFGEHQWPRIAAGQSPSLVAGSSHSALSVSGWAGGEVAPGGYMQVNSSVNVCYPATQSLIMR